MLIENLSINITPNGVPLIIHISQYDVGLRTFIFTPYTSSGTFTPDTAVSATLEGTKPDGNIVIHNCEYDSATGQITYTIQEQLAAVAGRVWSKIVLRDTDGNAIGYTAIVWLVDMAGVADGAVASDSDISALAEFIKEFGTINAYKSALDGAIAAVGGPNVASTVAQMTDRTKVYVYTGSQSGYTAGHWYYWNGSAWTDGGVYQATAVETDKTLAVTDMAADAKATGDAVTELKNDLTGIGESLSEIMPVQFNISYIEGYYIKTGNVSSPTAIIDLTPVSNTSFKYAIVDCAAGDVFNINATGGASARAWAFIDSNNALIRNAAEGAVDVQITAPENAAKLILDARVNQTAEAYKVIGDNTFYEVKETAEGNAERLDNYFYDSPNLVDPSTITAGYVISSAGVLTANSQYDTSDFFEVEKNTRYSWSNISYVIRYDENQNFISRTGGTVGVVNSATAKYMRVCGLTDTADTWRINKGDAAVDLPYNSTRLSDNVIVPGIANIESEIDLMSPSYITPFVPPKPYQYEGEDIVPYKTSGHLADIYALYDALVTRFPQYIKMEVLGMDASNQYEIRSYRIDNGTNYAYRLPRVVWLAAIHGNEGNTAISTYYMVKELLEKFGTDPVCYAIMSAIRLYVIPAVNPWGVENYSRLNANNVNLNRNFPVDWVYRDPTLAYGETKYGVMSASNGDNPYYYYGGGRVVYDDSTQTAQTTYVAEPETQIVMTYINSLNTGSNLNGKIQFAVNKHDAGNMTEEGATILLRDNYESDRKFLTNLCDWLKPLLMYSQNWLTQKNGLNIATVSYDAAGDPASAGTMDKWLNYIGIHGCLCEIPKGAGTAYSDQNHFADLCAIHTEFGLNMICNTIVNNVYLKDNKQTEQYTLVS